jgi:hypothetical protein
VNTVAEGWGALNAEGRTETGWHLRQIYPHAPCELLAGLRQPGSTPGLILEASVDHVPAGVALPRANGFAVDPTLLGGGLDPRVRFALTLTDRSYAAVFAVLCEDVAAAAAAAGSGRDALRAWFGRLHVWQAFMAKHGAAGLSESAVIGLIGELLVLQNTIFPQAGTRAGLAMWVGPAEEPNDFTLPNGFVEVKTTSRQFPQSLEIANTVQLDDSRGTILVVHVHLRPDPNGLSLPQLVATVRSTIVRDAADRVAEFEGLLMAAGYVDAQADLYTASYSHHRTDMYRVSGDFPRIRHAELRPGIRACRYVIDLDACSPYLVEPAVLTEMIGDLNID